jgi:hypothetical protein
MAKATAPIEPLREPADLTDEVDTEDLQALRAMIDRGMAVPEEELCSAEDVLAELDTIAHEA